MRRNEFILSVLLTIALLGTGVVAAETEQPLADAGLDQSVTQGTTVYLDGGGSHAPDGELVDYSWQIETPSGNELTPRDPNQLSTTFQVDELGVYEVTLTVTDDDGRSASDTLYIDVSKGDPPSVGIDGPNSSGIGETQQFTATMSAGDAPLKEVIWRVDGETVATFEATDSESVINRTFETLGTSELSVTVVDTSGQQDTAMMTTDVVEPDENSDGDSGPNSGGWYDGTAGDADPVIIGPQIIDGEKPLEATHRISTTLGSRIAAVTWRVDGEPVGSGLEYSTTWDPGEYQLSAVVIYNDGSKQIATFEDGDRDVLANPKPSVDLRGLDGFDGSVSGTVLATDEMNSLRSLSIRVDGVKVERWVGQSVGSKQISFKHDNVVDNDPHTVEIVATDDIGQERRVSKNVTPVGKPKIVSAEFVNEPVDSYHERIDADRYTAIYEVVVDLNGYSRENVSVFASGAKQEPALKNAKKIENNLDDRVRVHFEFAYRKPLEYSVDSLVELSDKPGEFIANSAEDELRVEPSSPEVRVRIQVQPEGPEYGQRRIILNASDSFDPDGTKLEFSWSPDEVKYSPGNWFFDSPERSRFSLSVRDQYKLVTTVQKSMEDYYSPALEESKIKRENNTYKPDEMVGIYLTYERHTADTEAFQNAPIEIEIVGSEGDVVKWANNPGAKPDTTGRREAFIKIPATEFIDGQRPRVKVYNSENPEQTARVNLLPQPEITNENEPFLANVQVSNLEYLVREPIYDKVTVDTRAQAELIDKSDYYIQEEKSQTLYVLEEYVHQDAEYEKQIERFDTEDQRDFFVRGANTDWRSAGTKTSVETVIETTTEWRTSRGGDGKFTGSTRRVQTSPPRYRTEYKFEYDREETYTVYEEVARIGTRRVTEEKTRTVRKCTPFGCYEYDDIYTISTTQTYTYTKTVQKTRTRTVTETYWSSTKVASGHRRTGESRREKLADAEYETQYEYKIEREYTTENTEYLASRSVQTQAPIDEWRRYDTVSSSAKAGFLSRGNNLRLAGTEQESVWILAKQTGSEEQWMTTLSNETTVSETRAAVRSDIVEYDRRAERRILKNRGTVETEYRNKGYLTEGEISIKFKGTNLPEFCDQYNADYCGD